MKAKAQEKKLSPAEGQGGRRQEGTRASGVGENTPPSKITREKQDYEEKRRSQDTPHQGYHGSGGGQNTAVSSTLTTATWHMSTEL